MVPLPLNHSLLFGYFFIEPVLGYPTIVQCQGTFGFRSNYIKYIIKSTGDMNGLFYLYFLGHLPSFKNGDIFFNKQIEIDLTKKEVSYNVKKETR